MSQLVEGINAEILRWARERSGHSLQEIAASFKKSEQTICDWEDGKSTPTYVQLEKLAYELYHYPIAIFFYPSPPEEKNISSSFRTLPSFEFDSFKNDTRRALRQAAALQLSLYELTENKNSEANIIFRDLRISLNDNIKKSATKIRSYLGISLGEQKKWATAEEAFKQWRDIIERHGVYVFKRSFKQKEISGFCLIDDEFPIIMVNNGSAFTRQIFTLFHELSHILFNTSGITKTDISHINNFEHENRKIEFFCNKLASEILVPYDDVYEYLSAQPTDEYLATIAKKYCVSKEVILRKYFDAGKISENYYVATATEWLKQLEIRDAGSHKKPGGNYYSTQATYLGKKYLILAFTNYFSGKLTLEGLADSLGVAPKNVGGLESVVLRGGM